jgi:hypothetical protein
MKIHPKLDDVLLHLLAPQIKMINFLMNIIGQ